MLESDPEFPVEETSPETLPGVFGDVLVGDMVKDFQVYLDDERYGVPTLHLVSAATLARAIELAEALWREGSHHRGVELRSGDTVLYAAGSLSPDVAAAESSRHVRA
jgi:hypothetical protein